MFDLLMLPVIAMFCIFVIDMANMAWKAKLRFKPFSCSMCMSFWISLIYLLVLQTQPFNAVMLAGATAYLTSPLKRLL
jgi:hypothetical protein